MPYLIEIVSVHGLFAIRYGSDDLALLRSIKRCFEGAAGISSLPHSCEPRRYHFRITGDGRGGFSVADYTGRGLRGLTREMVLYVLYGTFSDYVCASRPEAARLHASAVSTSHGACLLVGSSRSGKTSLSLLMDGHCSPLGDEHVWLNLQDFSVRCESNPFHVRQKTLDLLPPTLQDEAIAVETLDYLRSCLIPRVTVSSAPFDQDLPVADLVFPRFGKAQGTRLRRALAHELPALLLPSFASSGLPSQRFAVFVRMVGIRRPGLYVLDFDDFQEAACCLRDEVCAS